MNYKTRLVSTISQLVEELDVFNGFVMIIHEFIREQRDF